MRSSRRSEIDPFIVMDVMERARLAEASGRDIVHMEVGQPGTAAPEAALDALRGAMQEGPLGYTVALGLPELRARIAKLYDEWYGVDLDPQRVVITSGASGGFLLAFNALFDSDDRIGLAAPGYPSYRQILHGLGLEAIDIETTRESRFQPQPSDVAQYALDGLVVASPGNPTGSMLARDELAALMAACEKTGAAFISDEIYHGLEYERKAVSAIEISDECYVINSFSKYFSMTGWRIGWMVVPESHIRRVERLAQNMFICPSHASQIVALAALEARQELDRNLENYRANRALMLEELPKAGFTRIAPPDGAFYVYADVSEWTEDALAFSAQILDEAGVAVTPGLDFDPRRGGQYLRFSYAAGYDDIEKGLRRLKQMMAKRDKIR